MRSYLGLCIPRLLVIAGGVFGSQGGVANDLLTAHDLRSVQLIEDDGFFAYMIRSYLNHLSSQNQVNRAFQALRRLLLLLVLHRAMLLICLAIVVVLPIEGLLWRAAIAVVLLEAHNVSARYPYDRGKG